MEFEPLADVVLEPDEQEVDRSEVLPTPNGVVDDEAIIFFRRANRVALAKARPIPVLSTAVPDGRAVSDVPLLFALHAHPECVFEWARVIVDLTPTRDSVVADMSPRDVQDVAVDVTTTVGAELALSVEVLSVDVTANPQLTRKRTVFFPLVAATGIGFRKAYWDFHAKAGDYLHADKVLHLLVDAPSQVPVTANLTVRAKVRLRGTARVIPLLGRTGGISSPHPVRLA
ncbi:hypothetical protein ADK67_44145 [Saccharothrix sp. NRRL B-16348]|uniref:hypothetical protein n=1 Tax=Saccharothrix sp. NRRL B-16348 TaxID=1415542 RepID=UPI0006AF49B1|nr:hypothetical protein [Saccharothrix sp. NRRL B-16348]KOX13546.1 hypothetical protein ADK67_44145 [Saccharothrix sp. NRRL B-16348]